MSSEKKEKNSNKEAEESIPQRQRPQGGRVFLAPMPGFQWNPLLNLPRNRPCPCLSGKKFKACCLDRLPKVVADTAAKEYREQMKKPDLVFLTHKNQEEVKKRVDPLLFAEKAKALNPESQEVVSHGPEIPA